MFPSKEAVRLAVFGVAEAMACEGLFEQYADGGGELLACPYCVDARKLDGDALVANARSRGDAAVRVDRRRGDRLQLLTEAGSAGRRHTVTPEEGRR